MSGKVSEALGSIAVRGSGGGSPTSRRPPVGADGRLAHMVLEVAVFTVRDGHAERFTEAYGQARNLLAGSPGFLSARMTRGLEDRNRFVLLVEWETLEAHTLTFRGSDRFTQWRALIGPHFDSAEVQHVEDVAPAR